MILEACYCMHSVMSHLQLLELCGRIKETLWEPCQLVVVEFPEKQNENNTHTMRNYSGGCDRTRMSAAMVLAIT